VVLLFDAVKTSEDPANVSCALRWVAEVGLSARTARMRGTARTLAGSVRSDGINYTGLGDGAYLLRILSAVGNPVSIRDVKSVTST
jgi:aspartate aminotransferase-like enzyme